MKVIKGIKGQTVFDISIKYYGSVEGLNMLMEDNIYDGENIVNIGDLEGRAIRIREGAEVNESISDYFSTKQIVTT